MNEEGGGNEPNSPHLPAMARRTEKALIDSGVVAIVDGKLTLRGTAASGTADLPKGQNYLRQLGTWLECSAAKGCKVFGDLFK